MTSDTQTDRQHRKLPNNYVSHLHCVVIMPYWLQQQMTNRNLSGWLLETCRSPLLLGIDKQVYIYSYIRVYRVYINYPINPPICGLPWILRASANDRYGSRINTWSAYIKFSSSFLLCCCSFVTNCKYNSLYSSSLLKFLILDHNKAKWPKGIF